jgi:hypothetical protein
MSVTPTPRRRIPLDTLIAVAALGVLTALGIVSAQAYTCEDVRSLSLEQRTYYIRVFNITWSQQVRIRRACSGSRFHHNTTSVEGRTSHFGHREWDSHVEQ